MQVARQAEGRMAAIEYGSYYWCVILNGKEANTSGETTYLHADEMSIDPTGTLIFQSAGRRPAGTEPQQQNEKQGDKEPSKDEKDSQNNKKPNMMTYVAFAPGTWRVVYAAKLQDGYPASVEHWNTPGAPGLSAIVPPNSGAVGYPPHPDSASNPGHSGSADYPPPLRGRE